MFIKTILIIILSLAIIVIIVSLVITSTTFKEKRIKKILETWGDIAKSAVDEFKNLSLPSRIFTDIELENWENKYSQLRKAITRFNYLYNLKEIKNPESIIHSFYIINSKRKDLQVKSNCEYLTDKSPELITDYAAITNISRFVSYHEVQDFNNKWNKIINQFFELKNWDNLYQEAFPSYPILKEISKIGDLQDQRVKNNQNYIQQELSNNSEYFDNLFKYPLDNQQRKAIVTLEDNTLVVSSAGGGKTSTIVGKVCYLVDKKQINPKELVLTYTRKAAEELRERMGIRGIVCSTFHKHALDTIGLITRQKPTIAPIDMMHNVFEKLIKENPEYLSNVTKYITEYKNLVKYDEEYPDAEKRISDVNKYELISPYLDCAGNKIRLKSKQEYKIAIILTELGVNFQYEEPYCHNTKDRSHSQYRPDFVIHYKDAYGNNKVLYYEHFGINKNNEVPKWFGDGKVGGWHQAQEQYLSGIEWKKSIHEQYNTDLMITTSADFYSHSDIQSYIKELLTHHGVPIKPLTPSEKYQKIKEADSQVKDSLYTLVNGFIALVKANRKSFDEIISSISKDDDNSARNIFVIEKIIRPIFDEYEKDLTLSNQLDFTDILLKTATLCEKENPYSYKYILVDEFQDISMDKYIYLKSLRTKIPYTYLFCVGDDWQSIYRFSGSDLKLFYDFSKYFGYTAECKIETTHRFGQPLIDVSSSFILKNPNQKSKKITDNNISTEIRFIPYSSATKKQDIEKIVQSIPQDESIYILGRYSFNVDSICNYKINQDKAGNFEILIGGRAIRYLTIHSSKGLEADHVIILDCNSGIYGFPSLLSDDPIMTYVLSDADSYENSEERRVFYVGLTRAKKCVYCFFDKKNPSPFLNEFGEYSQFAESTEAICPHCKRGYVRILKSGVSKMNDPYITVKCTNKDCDYFETLFGKNILKYQPRKKISSEKFSIFLEENKIDSVKIDETKRIIKFSNSSNLIKAIIVDNIFVNKPFLMEINKKNDPYEISLVEYYDKPIYFLHRVGAEIFISNEEIERLFFEEDLTEKRPEPLS